MTIDLGAVGRGSVPDGACAAQQSYAAHGRTRRSRRFKLRYFLMIWAALSAVWAIAVAYNIYQRVDEQADMSVDVEHDLDQGLTPANCSGSCLAAIQTNPTFNRFDIASTYFQFGSAQMSEFLLGPPAALLLIGIGAFSVIRRRRSPI